MRKPEIEALLNPAQERLQDDSFWQHQADGLAFFLARDFAQYFCLPERFEELAVVEHRFHLKPLFPLISGDGAFYLLALSQNEVRLFHGSRYHISEVELDDDVPRSLADALGHDLTDEHLQFHTGGGDVSSPTYHGQGAGQDDVKPEIRKFFALLDKGLKKSLGLSKAPLAEGLEPMRTAVVHPVHGLVLRGKSSGRRWLYRAGVGWPKGQDKRVGRGRRIDWTWVAMNVFTPNTVMKPPHAR